MHYEIYTEDDIGGRNEQQDRVAAIELDGLHLVVLADGAGGHERGADAAQTVVDVSRDLFVGLGKNATKVSTDSRAGSELLQKIIGQAHQKVNQVAARGAGSSHTTCVLLLLTPTYAAWAHVGDSRLYRFHAGEFVARSNDHSVIEVLKMKGQITEEEMRTHPARNRLLSALGGEDEPEFDFDTKPIEPHDAFLVSSDGVWGNVDTDLLEETIRANPLKVSVRKLLDTAKTSGGSRCDNLSVAVARATKN